MSYQDRSSENESGYQDSQEEVNQNQTSPRSEGYRTYSSADNSQYKRESSDPHYPPREGNYNRDNNYRPREGGYNRDNNYRPREGGYNRDNNYRPREGGYNRDNNYPPREGGYNRDNNYRPREGGYNRDNNYPPREGGYNRDNNYRPREGGYNRDNNYPPREGGYNRDNNYRPREGGYNRDNNYRPREGGYNRDNNYPPREGGYNRDNNYRPREGGYNRDNNYPPREGGYNRDNNYRPREGGYNRDNNYRPREGGYNRDNNYPPREGGYNRDNNYRPREGGYNRDNRDNRYQNRDRQPRFDRTPRRQSPPITIEESLFLLPEHPLTQDFQRAIGMAKGTILEVDPRKKRGVIEIEGFKYKFEDERRRDLQNKYPIQKFLEREIMFAFWPTYSQKAAQYRQIDEAPTIKIANLRRTLPVENAVEIIGQVLMIEDTLFVMSVFSASQKKKYMVTINGKYPGESNDFIQMMGELRNGGIVYKNHAVLSGPVSETAQPVVQAE
ncbi:hypothetical protein COW36_13960 [bacterium (Candidatus Blackallbacteria) CG17_big_fil_post_rev_8_21_14_2_50_48_46]|uniref:Uncharacterized protein n=1 Tax=bacterium (Candidatus Blackallbacteria) CG17_big_fil_post_rev_8_21_14_2_50_48_46 TaxID=2014261 RepID=A0A2M7G336_9BACT|nr:MAG: hypothetical protein COW36_13960 [bacterium (Candidatus Blackallbacteria) CG17_big_fil_post_rev_8_21_14_2_50_48_46]